MASLRGRLAWQAWHFAALTVTLRGRCGTSRHRPPLCVAGVALLGTGMALVARLGSRLAPWAPPLLASQAVALGGIDRHFAWQAWHLAT